eukprot:CAMPEP_0119322958 /NCGR_PEP_ID=MMETSP1333-20130426/59606_1 /TAXON_ID=418940 /ORGANISM="Scyphosphaera apsteinii, Strain RCC1455" /LENGTH=47 /DNA_ID= /DNA_START= /DNA_END= /DNA_ORIENTATION=
MIHSKGENAATWLLLLILWRFVSQLMQELERVNPPHPDKSVVRARKQ